MNLLYQRAADPLDDVPLNLVFDSVWSDDPSAVVGDSDPFDQRFSTRLVDLDFGYRSDIRTSAPRQRYPSSSCNGPARSRCGRPAFLPLSLFGRSLKDIGPSPVVAQITEPEL